MVGGEKAKGPRPDPLGFRPGLGGPGSTAGNHRKSLEIMENDAMTQFNTQFSSKNNDKTRNTDNSIGKPIDNLIGKQHR